MKKLSFCTLLLFICSVSMSLAEDRRSKKNTGKSFLLYSNNFDAGEMRGCKRECHSKSCHECETQKIVFTPSPRKKGKSLLHALWNCDERAELKVSNIGRPAIGDTRWYSFAYYWSVNRGNGCIICQFPTYPTKRDFRKGCRGVGSDIRLDGDGSVTFTFNRLIGQMKVADLILKSEHTKEILGKEPSLLKFLPTTYIYSTAMQQ